MLERAEAWETIPSRLPPDEQEAIEAAIEAVDQEGVCVLS
jgi:hypothetical protein